jgi:hypothetical protein
MQLPQERDEEVYPVDLMYRTSFVIRDMPDRIALNDRWIQWNETSFIYKWQRSDW